jgi:hypothetical protein
MGFLIARATAGFLTLITIDPVHDALKASQLLGVDMDHVAGHGLLVAANRLGRLQILKPTAAEDLENPTHSGERCRQNQDDAKKRAALMPEIKTD